MLQHIQNQVQYRLFIIVSSIIKLIESANPTQQSIMQMWYFVLPEELAHYPTYLTSLLMCGVIEIKLIL
jgi:hypothetical protein